MLKSLYARISLAVLLLFVGVGALLLFLFEYSSETLRNETTQQLHLNLAEHIVDDLIMFKDGQLDTDSIKSAFHMIMLLGPSIELYVVDPAGNLLAYDAPEEKILKPIVDMESVVTFLNHKESLPILGDDPRSLDRQKIFSAAPIFEKGELKGYLYIIIGGENYDSIATALRISRSWSISFLGIGAALMFMCIVALLLFHNLTRPLRLLTQDIKAFAASDFREIPEHSVLARQTLNSGEIDQLNNTVHKMAHRIIDQLRELELNDSKRREFFAHISHDLRTPLAAVKAYLETLSYDQQLPQGSVGWENTQKALQTCDRLSKLIQDLFELARLENGQEQLASERFMLQDLLSDLVGSFSSQAHAKGVSLQFDMDENAQPVMGDLGKIDRVLQNLVENAIRYTPSEHSVTVGVHQNQRSRSVCIEIKDTGCGIPNAEIPSIFQPYFQASNKDQAYKKGAGLGLAISARLVSLHGSQLNVRSEENKGTVFSFELPVAV